MHYETDPAERKAMGVGKVIDSQYGFDVVKADDGRMLIEPHFWHVARAAYEKVCGTILRPPRKNHYSLDELGPTDFEFRGVTYRRNDLHFENKRGMQIEYSMWDVVGNWNSTTEPPSPLVTQDVAKPCIIYLHGKTPETKVEYETQRICFHRTKHLDSSTLHPK